MERKITAAEYADYETGYVFAGQTGWNSMEEAQRFAKGGSATCGERFSARAFAAGWKARKGTGAAWAKPTAMVSGTAAACYAERYAEAQGLLKAIEKRLAVHQKEQAAQPTNWGYAGDLGRITEQLAYVLADLGDTSAVAAKKLDR